TTTTTTTTTTGKRASATQVMCMYTLADSTDVCTATVGDATGQAGQPTGTVDFTSTIPGTTFSGGGSCSLAPQPGDVGVTSCSVSYEGSDTEALEATAAYSGDATYQPSTGSTQVLTAGPGNNLYAPTIQTFNPPTLNTTVTIPTDGSTVVANGTVTSDLAENAVCEVPSNTSDAGDQASAARAKTKVLIVRTSLRRRHVRAGKLRLTLRFNQRALLRTFHRGERVQLVVTTTISPPHSRSVTTFRRKLFVLRNGSGAHGRAAIATVNNSAVVVSKNNVWQGGRSGCGGTFTVTVPPAHLSAGQSVLVPVTFSWVNVTAVCTPEDGSSEGYLGFLADLDNVQVTGNYMDIFGNTSITFRASGSPYPPDIQAVSDTDTMYQLNARLADKAGVVSGDYTSHPGGANRQDCVATPPALTQTSFAGT
ncbi:MAG TPA: hypothetical protein VMD48_02100, partial [Solirubrobacteraceae bacterium]|nr:hypothetical protein [Solirubrobacteraceae bacterium]